MTSANTHRRPAVALIAAVGLATAGCGGDDTATEVSSPATTAAAAATAAPTAGTSAATSARTSPTTAATAEPTAGPSATSTSATIAPPTAGTSVATSAGTSATSAGTPVSAVIDPGDGGNYQVTLDPANFVTVIDNPYLPWIPGSKWVYEGESDGEAEHVEIEVTTETKMIQGITAIVVTDRVFSADELTEDTTDWYAQDKDGNVWYLGEDTAEYENGQVTTTAGSWEYGVNGALPGIAMEAAPTVDDAYRQEFLVDEAVDLAQVLATDETLSVGGTSYDQVLRTREWTPLEPDVTEEKTYAPGIGQIEGHQTAGGESTTELVEYTPGG